MAKQNRIIMQEELDKAMNNYVIRAASSAYSKADTDWHLAIYKGMLAMVNALGYHVAVKDNKHEVH